YLDADFVPEKETDRALIADIIFIRELNAEQERAFRIIANHATCMNPERLQMHLGGMGGTGKSRVIESLVTFFEARGEAHRFIVVAPTGSAAALLNGSTYHSVLGINDKRTYESLKINADVAARLASVDYVFMDETSMISCRDLYKICA
ncbi:hypothetical protein FIBSPDRAFT_700662, partial [Athelia psychrophila]